MLLNGITENCSTVSETHVNNPLIVCPSFWQCVRNLCHNLILRGRDHINILWIYVVRCIILILFAI